MARWLSFFDEYNLVVLNKPGKENKLADALYRRPDYDPRRDLVHQRTDDFTGDEDCAGCTELGRYFID